MRNVNKRQASFIVNYLHLYYLHFNMLNILTRNHVILITF